MTGILLVDKPEAMTSAGAIRALRPVLGRTKVGHLGTLDPFASGLLPLCLGEATKVARYLLLERKEYTGTIRLGVATDTLDHTGATVETRPVPPLDQAMVDAVAARFTGSQQQVPPMYSALKQGGVPLYKLARRGIEVARAARDIDVERLELHLRPPDAIEFAAACSKGTYVRVLAADIGQVLGTVAHLERLRRVAVGPFRIAEARTPDVLVVLPRAGLPLVPLRTALAAYRTFAVPATQLVRLRHGQQEPLAALPPPEAPDETALLLDAAGEVVGVIEADVERRGWRLVRVLGSDAGE